MIEWAANSNKSPKMQLVLKKKKKKKLLLSLRDTNDNEAMMSDDIYGWIKEISK